VIVWLRRDLRLADNPALHAAAASGRPVLPVFIWAVSFVRPASSCSAAVLIDRLLAMLLTIAPCKCRRRRRLMLLACCFSLRALLQPDEWGRWPPGGAAMHWLHHSLASLDADLQRRYGTRLHFYNAGSTGSSSAQVGGSPGRGQGSAAWEALAGRQALLSAVA
jgi:deoxyribodipyrimidine photolyase